MLTQLRRLQLRSNCARNLVAKYFIGVNRAIQGLPILTVGTSMAVTITHVFLWGSSATNHIENALMGSPWGNLCPSDNIHI
jgi:hypothetical protein